MTTPSLDLPALRSDIERAAGLHVEDTEHPWMHVDPDHLIELIDRAEAAEAAIARVEAICQDTDGNWLDPEDESNNVGSILQAVRGDGA